MKIYTSYFYKLRFFKPNMIPISTAKWDPKWYHEGKGQENIYIDKNNVINGLRADVFAPGPTTNDLCYGKDCSVNNPNECAFIKEYERQLDKLEFTDIIYRTERLCEKAREVLHFEEEPIAVFLVHEAPNNPCSERIAIQNWFKKNGISVEEWEENKNVSV